MDYASTIPLLLKYKNYNFTEKSEKTENGAGATKLRETKSCKAFIPHFCFFAFGLLNSVFVTSSCKSKINESR